MNPLCGFQSLCGIQTRSEVEIEKVLMQRDEPFKGFPNIFSPTKTPWWAERQAGQHLRRPPPPHLQCRAGTKAHTKASKVARGSRHIRGHLIFACVWGQEGGREDGNTDSQSTLFLYNDNVNRLQKGVSLGLKCYLGSEQYFKWLLLLANSPTT